MASKSDPNAARAPGEAFRYKPQKALVASEALQQQMTQLGMLRVNHVTAAAVLGVSRDTLERFWKDNPDHREAFEAGKELDNVRTSRLLRVHAVSDPGTARFLAKNYLDLSDDPSKAKADEATAKAITGMKPEERTGRILELQAKLIGSSVSHETGGKSEEKQGRHKRESVAQGADDARRSGDSAQYGGGTHNVVSAPSPQRRGQENMAQPQAHEGSAVEKLQARLAELEASAVRKNPRKDGQPHTDRSKQDEQRRGPRKEGADTSANRGHQGGLAHAPARLPGRLGPK